MTKKEEFLRFIGGAFLKGKPVEVVFREKGKRYVKIYKSFNEYVFIDTHVRMNFDDNLMSENSWIVSWRIPWRFEVKSEV